MRSEACDRDGTPRSLSNNTLEPAPCTLVIFGGCGDLSQRKLLPALYNLCVDGVLPERFAAVGFARRDKNDESFRAFAREGLEKYSRRGAAPEAWSPFEHKLFYHKGDLDKPEAYRTLKQRLEEIELEAGLPGNRIFYLSVPPSMFATCVEQLRAAGLTGSTTPGRPFTRVIVEKPIGHDLASAQQINATVSQVFDEEQVYRIDHYLGKETVQNIMVMRFGNSIFEPLWNQKHIDHVQITVAETEGVGSRAGYYEESGALRDMVQNHILQLVCLTAMEPPWALLADVVRDHKLEVLKCLRPITSKDIECFAVRAQYDAGYHREIAVPGYRREEGVRSDSTTETFVALKLFIDNWRWASVPFYIRTGKRLPKRASEISVQFKEVPHMLFNADPTAPIEPNVFTLRVQPDEGLSLRMSAKVPGSKVRVSPVKMDFAYASAFGEQSPEAYERLLLDVMAGDATHFMRRDAVEASWALVDPILKAWEQSQQRWLPAYAAGTWGPVEADRLIEADGRRWINP